jgi:hypothetical protein
MGANSRYKDSVFPFLFSDPDTLRELYGAIAGVELIVRVCNINPGTTTGWPGVAKSLRATGRS